MFVLFLSKNENSNGFDTIGLNSSSSDYRRLANILFIVVFFSLFLLVACFRLSKIFEY